ncbi:hypothetical protein ACFLZJ_00805 [Nanoarchaeota archaeon]
MFEAEVKENCEKISKNPLKKEVFYIITHKKYKREVYFKKNSPAAKKFIRVKFRSFVKSLAYLLIKSNLTSLFFKKIELPSDIGEVIFVAGQIKIFDLRKKIVISFPKKIDDKKIFLDSKLVLRKIEKLDISPKIFKIKKEVPYCVEELLREYYSEDYSKVFEKLLDYYGKRRIEEKNISKISKDLKNKIKKNKDLKRKEFFLGLLDKLSIKKSKILLVHSHGDFAKGQILRRGNSFVFTDWGVKKEPIIADLVHFIGIWANPLENKDFLKYLRLYPKEVQKNIRKYLILNEIFQVNDHPKNEEAILRRIKKLII